MQWNGSMGDPGVVTIVPDDFAERVRSLRGRLGLTQTQLAARLGVSFATVNRWENAQARPSTFTWNQLQRLYETEILGADQSRQIVRASARRCPAARLGLHH